MSKIKSANQMCLNNYTKKRDDKREIIRIIITRIVIVEKPIDIFVIIIFFSFQTHFEHVRCWQILFRICSGQHFHRTGCAFSLASQGNYLLIPARYNSCSSSCIEKRVDGPPNISSFLLSFVSFYFPSISTGQNVYAPV